MGNTFNLTINPDGSAKILIDLPNEKVNKFSGAVVNELKQLLSELKNKKDIKILSIESGKENIFFAGADISEFEKIKTAKDATSKSREGQELFNQIEKLPFPTVAVINGACLGGGIELALACTYRIVTDNPKTNLGCPEVNLGIIPGWGGTLRLPRLIGIVQSLPIILSGKPVNAKKALRIKLADSLIAKEFAEEKTAEFLKYCLTKSGKNKILKDRKKGIISQWFFENNLIMRSIIFNKVKKDLIKKTGGNYPAPLKALEVVKQTYRGSFNKGLRKEANAFGELFATQTSKNLVQLYFTGEELKKDPGAITDDPLKKVNSAGVVGSGVMGGGIAWLFSSHDISVRMKDINWDTIGKGFASASKIYNQLKKIKKIKPYEINLKMHRISGTLSFSGFNNLDLVIEAVVENMDVKKQLLSQIEENVSPDTIICSNTSSLSINEMAKGLKNPERFVGMHFFNPVNRMPLVEIIPGEKTSPATVAAVVALSKKLNKVPVIVQDCPGFLVNRILLSYLSEALNIMMEGADISRVDKLIFKFGMPMGPFLLADEIGIDICYHAMKSLGKNSPLLDILFNKEKLLGKKGKKGFYIHEFKNRRVNPKVIEIVKDYRKTSSISPKSFTDRQIVDRCINVMINEAKRCLEEKIVAKASYLDMALIMGIGFPAFRGGLLRYAEQKGEPK